MAENDARSRRLAIVLVVFLVAVFVVQLVALALGSAVVVGVCSAVLVLSWFAMRSWQKRRERA